MFYFLLTLDRQIFLVINHLPHGVLLDNFFLLLSGIGNFGIVWFVIGALVLWEEEVRDKKGLVALIISALTSIVTVDLLLKNLIHRLRPEFVLSQTLVIGDLVKSYSFPSGHAAFAFAGAFVLSRFHPKYKAWLYVLAILIAFSRIYLGKHFPSDVLGGAIIGTLVGNFSVLIVKRIYEK